MNRKERRAAAKGAAGQGGNAPTTRASAGPATGVSDLFAAALKHHQAGRLAEAEQFYRQILAVNPRHPDSLHLLGVIAYQAGDCSAAVKLIGQAISVNAQVPVFHCNIGLALHVHGDMEQAVVHYRKALALNPNYAEAHFNLANSLHALGRPDEAIESYGRSLVLKSAYAEAHNNLGTVLQNRGRLDEAIASYGRALNHKPDYVEAHYNLGNAFKEREQLDQAVASYRRALAFQPDYAEVYSNLGIVLREQGHLDEASACYRRAIEIKPDYLDAHNNLGIALQDQGRLEESAVCYRRVIEIKPDYAEAYSNLGTVLQLQGHLDEAVANYSRAVELKPDYVEAHCNLGTALKDQDRLDEAAACYRRALALKPDYVEALNGLTGYFLARDDAAAGLSFILRSLGGRQSAHAKGLFVECIKRCRFSQFDANIHETMVLALSEPWGPPNGLAQVGSNIVKLNPDIEACVARAANAWPRLLSARELFGSTGLVALATDSLLRALLCSAPNSDIALERFLTAVRLILLEIASSPTVLDSDTRAALGFYCALARQCFVNEYVFSYSDAEIRKAGDLRDSLAAALEADGEIPALWLVAVAAYFPLHSLQYADRLLDRTWPEAIDALLAQQVREPAEEIELRGTIPRLTDIEDDVSLLVQDQYEENPYPRWISIARNDKPRTVNVALRRLFPLSDFQPIENSNSPEILIAGCGTGQHPIDTAQQFQRARVLAVDLSKASLSYAKRKTRELGLTSIEYAQADLLAMGTLGRSFDVIESGGVLHHLADPWGGWRVLLSMLRPRGLMKLGFYSEVARREIVRGREIIAERGYGTTADEIRRCRQYLFDLESGEQLKTSTTSTDFFSISTCRDLLFHVQEHRMTLTGIEQFLEEQDLKFLGFVIEASVVRAYRQRFPDDRAATNLGQWQIFENENPSTFFGMYQFWVQKRS